MCRLCLLFVYICIVVGDPFSRLGVEIPSTGLTHRHVVCMTQDKIEISKANVVLKGLT
jgi:hypothetical protein